MTSIEACFRLADCIKEKYNVYTTIGYESLNKKWSFYTSDIGHHNFTDIISLKEFLKKLIFDEMFYKTRDIGRLEERLESINETLADLVEEKQDIKNTISTLNKESI